MSQLWPNAVEGRIPTKNKTGFMFTEIAGASPAFIHDTKNCEKMVLDLGCAYGVVTLRVLEQATCPILAFDLSTDHLEILSQSVPQELVHKLRLQSGYFPNDLNLTENSIDAIHSSYMFHFLNGTDLVKGLRKCFQVLKQGGKIYINTMSAYLCVINFLMEYENNINNGLLWPGEIYDLQRYVPEQDVSHAPNFMHVHKLEDIEKIILKCGFLIDDIFYYDLKEPAWFASAGKGFIGIIARKN